MRLAGLSFIGATHGSLSSTWFINMVSNIVAMLMLLLIQNTQNPESAALQPKVDELLSAASVAQNAFINLEELTEDDLVRIKECYPRLAEAAAREVWRPPILSTPPAMLPE
jgi:low affinity Fe/Cu permease